MFKKSSYSQNTGCVEADALFRTSSHSGETECAEAGRTPVMIRDSKQPGTSPVITVHPAAWTAFIGHISA